MPCCTLLLPTSSGERRRHAGLGIGSCFDALAGSVDEEGPADATALASSSGLLRWLHLRQRRGSWWLGLCCRDGRVEVRMVRGMILFYEVRGFFL